MKKIILALLLVPALALAQKTPKGVTYDAQILRVSDGDTIVDSDTVHMIDYLNKKMKLNENDLPKVRKVIMEYSHEKIRRHFM